MASLNNCQFIGNLGKDPELRYAASGDAMCNFSIACSESWKDKQTGEKKEHTEWINISTFGKLAEICGQYLKKGSQVYIAGKQRTRKWQDKDGNDRYTTEIRAEEMKMLGGRPEGGHQSSEYNQEQRQEAPKQNKPSFDDLGDDVPF